MQDAKKVQASFEHLQAREAAMRAKEDELQKLVRRRTRLTPHDGTALACAVDTCRYN